MTKTTKVGGTITRVPVKIKNGWIIQTTCTHPVHGSWGVIESCMRFPNRNQAEKVIESRFKMDAHKFI